MNRYDSAKGTFVHLINYDYQEEQDRVEPVKELTVKLRDISGDRIRVHHLDGETDEFSVRLEDGSCIITLRNVPVYTVIEIC